MKTGDLPRLTTRVGRAGWDEHRYFGWRVFGELAGHERLSSLAFLSATGRRATPEATAIIDDVATVLSVADPRIWPLKLCRLAASHGGLVQGIAAAYLSMDNPFIGVMHVSRQAAEFLVLVKRQLAGRLDEVACESAVERALQQVPRPSGFGVPLREWDERVPALRRCVTLRGRHQLPWWLLFERVAPMVHRRIGLAPNMASAWGAIAMDLGLGPSELGHLALCLSVHIFLAHAVEGAAQRHPILQRLPAESVRYVGVARRRSPRAEALAVATNHDDD